MANVLLTTRCNLSCKYCFAKERMKSKKIQNMPMDNVRKVIAFLKKSDFPNFRMMGGEPTLHPKFAEILELALIEGMHVNLLSNATWPLAYNDLFNRISPNNLLFLLNIDHPDNYSTELWERIETNLSSISGRKGVSISFNIFEKKPSYEYILDLAEKYQIKWVRLSFSLPVFDVNNTRLELEEYEKMSGFIIDFVKQGEARGIKVHMDNAVPLCIFSYEQAGELLLKGVLDLEKNARCKPIIDISPDLSVCNCFCLSKLYNKNLGEFDSLKEIHLYYQQVFRPYQDDIFPMEKCTDCEYRTRWGCQGGCTTFSIEKAKGQGGKFWLRETTSAILDDNAMLSLAENITIKKYEIPKITYTLKNDETNAYIEIGPSFETLLGFLNGRHTVGEVVKAYLPYDDNTSSQSSFDVFEHQTMVDGFKNMLLGLVLGKFIEIKTK